MISYRKILQIFFIAISIGLLPAISACTKIEEPSNTFCEINGLTVSLTMPPGQQVEQDVLVEIQEEIMVRVAMLDPQDGSILGALNTSEVGELMEMGSVGGIITDTLEYTAQCDGNFDPTLQVLWDIYDFENGGRHFRDFEIEGALHLVDYTMVELDRDKICRVGEDIRVGLGPTMPGAIADMLHESLSLRESIR